MSNKKRIQQTEEAIRYNQNAWLLSSSKADAAIYMKLVREFEKQKKRFVTIEEKRVVNEMQTRLF